MAGSHYNRAWQVHSIISEALERLLIQRFFAERNMQIPIELSDVLADPELFSEEVTASNITFIRQFEDFKDKARNGALGKTPQYWIIYMDLMRFQHMAHTAVQTNDYDLRVVSWEKVLPFYFALNMFNYSRYGRYYLEILKHMEKNYPGLRHMLERSGLSVQAQDRYPVRTAVDQRGEQTINRDAKTTGGIKAFSTNSSSVLKWCLNRADQSTNTKALNNIAGLSKNNYSYKALRPSQVLKSEMLVNQVQEVLTSEYLNPFDSALDKTKLYNLSSGLPLDDETTEAILKIPKTGIRLTEEFKQQRLVLKTVPFHAPITRNSYQTFNRALKTVAIEKNNKVKTQEVNRNIISNLLSFTVKTGKPIDFEAALQYPLSPVPLSIANADGRRRETAKSKLKDIIYTCRTAETASTLESEKDSYVLDMIALIRTMSEIPESFEGL